MTIYGRTETRNPALPAAVRTPTISNQGKVPAYYGGGTLSQAMAQSKQQAMLGKPERSRSASVSFSNQRFSPEMKAMSDAAFDKAIGGSRSTKQEIQNLTDQRVGGLKGAYMEQLQKLAQLGGADRNRINRDFSARAGSVGAQLAGTGLYNSTVQGNMRQGVERNRQEAMGSLEESLRMAQLQSLQERTGAVDRARSENMQTQASLADLIASLYAQKGATLPTLSGQTSRSDSVSYA